MYELNPPAVYAHESVVADPRYAARMQAVLDALVEPREPVVFTDADLPRLIRGGLLDGRVTMGTLEEIPDPSLLFNTFRFDDRRAERIDALRRETGIGGGHVAEALTGSGPFAWFEDRLPRRPGNTSRVCRACWRIHFQSGCAHKCHYCGLGGLLATMVNVEEYLEHLDELIAAHPWQETYLLEDDADVLCLEPELGCLGPIIEHFGGLTGRYLILHTKSWNVEWMLDLKHNGQTMPVWSLAGRGQQELFEPNTGTLEGRIGAARACQDAGYTVRYKFKPIVPVRTWREDAAEAVRLLFEQTDPDVISLCVFMWTSADELDGKLDRDALAEEYVAAADEAAEEMGSVNARPFPHWVRAEIYQHYLDEIRRWNPDVPVSLSTETFGMWKQFAPQLGMGPLDYVCGCGPNSTPHRRKLHIHPYLTPPHHRGDGVPQAVGMGERKPSGCGTGLRLPLGFAQGNRRIPAPRSGRKRNPRTTAAGPPAGLRVRVSFRVRCRRAYFL